VLQRQKADAHVREAGNRCLVLRAKGQREELEAAEAVYEAACHAAAVAQAFVNKIKAEIQHCRTARAVHGDPTKAQQALNRIFPDDVPAVPWGVRPAAGERGVPETPPISTAPRGLDAEQLVNKILEAKQ